jgi:hypothetical protein
MSRETKKFYRPGTLPEKGTKISLKTQPYINGVVFDINDPISSFHKLLMSMKVIVDEYEMLRNVPGINEAVPSALNLQSGITGQVKLLLDYLSQSPIEVVLKEQKIDEGVLTDLASIGVIDERN